MDLFDLAKRVLTLHKMLLPIILMLILVLAACGEAATATPSPTMPPTATALQAVFPFSVTDSNGKEVVFQGPPQRIIAYDNATVEFLFAMGEGQRIAGVHQWATYPPEAADVPKVGDSFNINLEKIVELKPDIIYTFYGASVPDLESVGVKVLYLETPSDLQGILDQARMWGRITGNVTKAEEVAREFESRLEDLVGQLSDVQEGPRVFHDDSLLFTRGPDTLMGKVYTLLKAQNIAHDVSLYGQLSLEVIVDRDPEVIITTFAERVQQFTDDPAFKDVTAVKEGRVYFVDADLINVAGPRFVQGIEQLARVLHPDGFQ